MAVTKKPPLGKDSLSAIGLPAVTVCAAPVTATPGVMVVMLGKVGCVPTPAELKLKVPVPPFDTLAMAMVGFLLFVIVHAAALLV